MQNEVSVGNSYPNSVPGSITKGYTTSFLFNAEQALEKVELTSMKLLLQVSKEIMKHITQTFVICLKIYIYIYMFLQSWASYMMFGCFIFQWLQRK